MHVAYISVDHGIPLFGPKGASNHVREFVRALASSGCRVTVITARLGKPAGDLACRVELLPAKRFDDGPPPASATETAALAANDPLAGALEQLDRQDPFGLIYERYSLWSYAGFSFAGTHDIPYVLEVNSPLRLEQKKYRRLNLEPAAKAIELLLFRSAHLVAGVSSEVVDYVTTISGRRLPSLVLPNGVDLDLFRRVELLPEPPPFVVGFLGSLKPWHGIEHLLEAFRTLAGESPDYSLLVVGEGPLAGWITEYAREHALEARIRLTGGVEKNQVPELVGAMHVAVAPYPEITDFYFSPLKVFEYMAAGRAIVASRIGQMTELLRDGETALLTKPGRPEDLAEQIRRLRNDSSLRLRLGAAARREAFRQHGWESRVRTVMDSIPWSKRHNEAPELAGAR